MPDKPTKDEIDQRAREAARRLMATPYEKQEWGGKRQITETRDGASTPEKPGPSGEWS